jgi:hypothetical protein
MSLKRVLLVTPGRYEREELTPSGIEDVRWLGQQISNHGLEPRVMYSTDERYCVASACMLAGILRSVRSMPASLGFSFAIPSDVFQEGLWSRQKITVWEKKHRTFWGHFREMMRMELSAQIYLRKAYPVPYDAEEVAIVAPPGFGGVFPKYDEAIHLAYTHWAHPIIWTLDIQTQRLSLSCNPSERFGAV